MNCICIRKYLFLIFLFLPFCINANQVSEEYFVELGSQYRAYGKKCIDFAKDKEIVAIAKKTAQTELNPLNEDESEKILKVLQCYRFLGVIKDIYVLYTRKDTMQAFDRYTIFPQGVRELIIDFMGTYDDVVSEFNKTARENDQLYIDGKITLKQHTSNFNLLEKETRESVLKEYQSLIKTVEDAISGKPLRLEKDKKKRESASVDVVAQVLNYASGVPEDASGESFFYPVNTENGQCVYKIAISNPEVNNVLNGLAQAEKFMSAQGIQGGGQTASIMEDGIDLNKGDLKNINFYKLQGAKQNKFTGVTAYLRYQSRIEGLPDLFECDSNSCNIDRLKRGWALVQSKCKGTKKAF